jgi:hypothetical protein
MKAECCICHRPHDKCEVVVLTSDEKAVLRTSGWSNVPDSLAYCPPCWKITTDKERGAQFMRGLGEATLRRYGVVDAEGRASQFHKALLAKAKV